MKKTVFGMAALAMVALASCGGNGKCNSGTCGAKQCDGEDCVKTFVGELPAADCDGIRYTLQLEFDKEDKCMKGDYNLLETYIGGDTVSVAGQKGDLNFKSEGDFTVTEKDGKKIIKLVADMKDSDPKADMGPIYFMVDNDSTLTMLNSDMERPASDLNYSLKLK